MKQGTNTGPSTCSQCPCWVTLGQKLALSAPWRGLCDRGRGSEAPCRSPPRQRWGGVPASGSAGGAPASPPARPPQDSSSGAQRHGGRSSNLAARPGPCPGPGLITGSADSCRPWLPVTLLTAQPAAELSRNLAEQPEGVPGERPPGPPVFSRCQLTHPSPVWGGATCIPVTPVSAPSMVTTTFRLRRGETQLRLVGAS